MDRPERWPGTHATDGDFRRTRSERTREKVEHQLWRLAQEILHLGLSVVLDFGLWARSERDEMRNTAPTLSVGIELHYRDVPIEELWRRIEARNLEPPWDSYPIRRADLEGMGVHFSGARWR
jgi:predicted kinase